MTKSPTYPAPGLWWWKVVEPDGTVVAGSPTAWTADNLESITWRLNAPTTATVTASKTSPLLAALLSPDGATYRELQVFYGATAVGADLAAWLVPARLRASGRQPPSLQLEDPLWYLAHHRFVGHLYDDLIVLWGNFEGPHDGEDYTDHWTFTPNVTDTNPTDGVVLTPRCLQLVSAEVAGDEYAAQSFTIPANTDDCTVTVSAWHQLVAYSGPAAGKRGMWAELKDDLGNVRGRVSERIDGDTAPGWTERTGEIDVPPHDQDWTLDLRLYAPEGTIRWDWARVHISERLRFDDTDQADIVAALVDHAQDTAIFKGDLNLASSTPATGILRSKAYEFSEHAPIWRAISELVGVDDGLDVSLAITTTTRTVTTHYPRRGSDLSLTLEWGVNVADYDYGWDGAEAKSSVSIMRGGGPGPAGGVGREHGWARDDTALGGLRFEEVVSAQTGTRIDDCLAGAIQRLAARARPETFSVRWHRTETVNPAAEVVAGNVEPGDRVNVVIDDGWVQVDGVYRVLALTVTPADESVRVELGPWEAGS